MKTVRITEEEFELASRMKKDAFVEKFKETIMNWVENKESEILRIINGKKYPEKAVEERNQLELAINESRERNNGGVDLDILDRICIWGFYRKFPLKDPYQAIEITREAFEHVDKENYCEAVSRLMDISGVGISRASKIIGLSDQHKLCIYDSRVGHALRDLKKENIKLIKCPPDRSFKRDCDYTTKSGWAMNYERLIWAIEIIREYFETKGYFLRAAEIEMALYVMGE